MTRPLHFHRVTVSACHLVIALALISAARAQTTTPSAATPLDELQTHLDKMKSVRTLALTFVCEKHLAALESPLISEGRLWIQKTDKGATNLRFSTEKPYVSELILMNNKVYARSQHEQSWTITDASARPGLSLVMQQLGGWSTGQPGALADSYNVARALAGAKIPDLPKDSTRAAVPATNNNIDIYVLTPKSKDLKAAIKTVEVAIDPATGFLVSVEITTAQDDATRYWFLAPQINAPLPADTFSAK